MGHWTNEADPQYIKLKNKFHAKKWQTEKNEFNWMRKFLFHKKSENKNQFKYRIAYKIITKRTVRFDKKSSVCTHYSIHEGPVFEHSRV